MNMTPFYIIIYNLKKGMAGWDAPLPRKDNPKGLRECFMDVAVALAVAQKHLRKHARCLYLHVYIVSYSACHVYVIHEPKTTYIHLSLKNNIHPSFGVGNNEKTKPCIYIHIPSSAFLKQVIE